MSLKDEIARIVADTESVSDDSDGGEKKNYTELLSNKITSLIAKRFQEQGLSAVRAPSGRDKQFMGGYGTKVR
jgi:hypothetical protein